MIATRHYRTDDDDDILCHIVPHVKRQTIFLPPHCVHQVNIYHFYHKTHIITRSHSSILFCTLYLSLNSRPCRHGGILPKQLRSPRLPPGSGKWWHAYKDLLQAYCIYRPFIGHRVVVWSVICFPSYLQKRWLHLYDTVLAILWTLSWYPSICTTYIYVYMYIYVYIYIYITYSLLIRYRLYEQNICVCIFNRTKIMVSFLS